MKVFISWSGNTSRQIAEALRDWLPMVVQAVKPYMNQRDNEAGVRWEEVVSEELKETDFGILCLTPDSLRSPWLNFEAGALGKAVDRARVVPLLYKLDYEDVEPPLSMFMGKPLDEQGVRETLSTINKHLDEERRLEPVALDGAFKAMWPVLEKKLADIEGHDPSGDPEPRDSRKILVEILGLVRGLSQPSTVDDSSRPTVDDSSRPTVDDSSRRRHSRQTIAKRVNEELGPGVDVIAFGDHLTARSRTPTMDCSPLSPGELKKVDQLLAEAEALGVELVFGPEFHEDFDPENYKDDKFSRRKKS